jgi:hypothetical protein
MGKAFEFAELILLGDSPWWTVIDVLMLHWINGILITVEA